MPHEETSAKPCFQLYSQHSREENLTFGNLINTKLTDGFGLYKIVCLSFLSCFLPETQQTPPSAHAESGDKPLVSREQWSWVSLVHNPPRQSSLFHLGCNALVFLRSVACGLDI